MAAFLRVYWKRRIKHKYFLGKTGVYFDRSTKVHQNAIWSDHTKLARSSLFRKGALAFARTTRPQVLTSTSDGNCCTKPARWRVPHALRLRLMIRRSPARRFTDAIDVLCLAMSCSPVASRRQQTHVSSQRSSRGDEASWGEWDGAWKQVSISGPRETSSKYRTETDISSLSDLDPNRPAWPICRRRQYVLPETTCCEKIMPWRQKHNV
jgi:hypothetical protein